MNLWPALSGETQLSERTLHLVGPGGNRSALRDADWKLILTEQKSGKSKAELFNLANDPNETTDLSEANPKKVTEMKTKMTDQRKADIASQGGL